MKLSCPLHCTAILAVCACLHPCTSTAQSTPAAAAGCRIADKEATCNWSAFRAALAASHVVAVEYRSMDQSTGTQLKDLARKLGKSLATPDTPGELTFTAVPADNNGITIGPADQEIVELRIYAGPSAHGRLIWVESYRAQPDRPWAMSVLAVIQQFQDHLAKR